MGVIRFGGVFDSASDLWKLAQKARKLQKWASDTQQQLNNTNAPETAAAFSQFQGDVFVSLPALVRISNRHQAEALRLKREIEGFVSKVGGDLNRETPAVVASGKQLGLTAGKEGKAAFPVLKQAGLEAWRILTDA